MVVSVCLLANNDIVYIHMHVYIYIYNLYKLLYTFQENWNMINDSQM